MLVKAYCCWLLLIIVGYCWLLLVTVGIFKADNAIGYI